MAEASTAAALERWVLSHKPFPERLAPPGGETLRLEGALSIVLLTMTGSGSTNLTWVHENAPNLDGFGLQPVSTNREPTPSVSVSMMEDPGYDVPNRETPSQSSHSNARETFVTDYETFQGPAPLVSEIRPMCAGSPSVEYHHRIVYAYPNGGTSNYTTKLSTIRQIVNQVNGELRDESSQYWNRLVDFRVRCISTHEVDVKNQQLNIFSHQASFQNIYNDLISIGLNFQTAKYWVFYDGPGVCGCSGEANWSNDDSASINNLNNKGPQFAVIYNTAWEWTNMLHEVLHTMGAVQLSAPHSDGAAHCNQGSIMFVPNTTRTARR